MIRETVEIARETKRLYPDLPVVLGGWHPSLLPRSDAGGGVCRRGREGPGRRCAARNRAADRSARIARGHRGRRATRKTGRLVFNKPRALKPIVGHAAEGVSSGGFRRVRAHVRPALGELYVQLRVSLQLLVLHECGRVRAQVECAAAGSGGRRIDRSGDALPAAADLDRRRQLHGGSRTRAWRSPKRSAPRSEVQLEHPGVHQPGDALQRGRASNLCGAAGLEQVQMGADSGSPKRDAPDEQGFSEAGNDLRSRRAARARRASSQPSI